MIKSRMDGEIAKVHFEEGQEVKEGDVLFSLDDRAVRAQLQQAEANARARPRPARAQSAGGHAPDRAENSRRGVGAKARGRDHQRGGRRGDGARQRGDRSRTPASTSTTPPSGRPSPAAPARSPSSAATWSRRWTPRPRRYRLVTITQLRPIYVAFTVPEWYLADLRTAMAERIRAGGGDGARANRMLRSPGRSPSSTTRSTSRPAPSRSRRGLPMTTTGCGRANSSTSP